VRVRARVRMMPLQGSIAHRYVFRGSIGRPLLILIYMMVSQVLMQYIFISMLCPLSVGMWIQGLIIVKLTNEMLIELVFITNNNCFVLLYQCVMNYEKAFFFDVYSLTASWFYNVYILSFT